VGYTGLRWWGSPIGRSAREGLVRAKNQNRAAGARFWPTKRGGVMRRVEGTLLGWGTPDLRWCEGAIGLCTRGGWF
jgi:hypothetical protein